MRYHSRFAVCIGFSLFACGAEGRLTNPNPNATIAFAGPSTVSIPGPGQGIANPFAVRIVDPNGDPIQGLTVEFSTDVSVCIEGDPHCQLPPSEVYGHFADAEEVVLTDADGVASVSGYVGGTVPGNYFVGAFVSEFGSLRNEQVLKGGGDIYADFTIYQFADTVNVPVTAPWVRWVLAFMLVCIGTLQMVFANRVRGTGR